MATAFLVRSLRRRDLASPSQLAYKSFVSHDSAHSAAHLSRLFCSRAVIGIDVGASNSRVALMGKNAIVIDSATPSVVAFNQKGETLVGFQAKRQVVNSVFGTKRLIGRCFDDEQVQKQIMKMVPYKVVRAPNGDAWVEVNGKQYSPSLIGAFVLSKMKKTAEDYLGKQVSKAVITVPAYFNDAQRQATEDAGRIAGLHVQRILSEPAAAALSYGIGSNSKDKGLVAVFNLGGTTFDISILEIANGVTEVKATNSDTFLGGEDFDNILLEYLVSEYRKTDGIDLTKDTRALQRLRQAAEKAKAQLSSATETEINLPFITADASGAKHFYITLTRSKFESLVNPLIESTKQACKNCLKDAGLTTKQVDEVLLVGGMTHVPKVQEAVEEVFGKSPSKGVNPDEAVVLGAAIQGGVLQGDMKEPRFVDVKEHYRTLQGAFTGLFNNNTINSAKNRLFSSVGYNKAQVGVEDLHGEQGGILQGAMKELRFVDVQEHYRTLQGAFTGLLKSNTINSAKNRLFSSVADNKAQVGDKDLQGEQGGSRPGGSEGDQAQETKSEMKESDMQDWIDLLRLMLLCYLLSR